MDQRRLLIIDTDPGVDDAMAILLALNSPEYTVVGLTTVYGNVPTALATENALRLLELAGAQEACVVAQGATRSMKAGLDVQRIADFVHGPDGFGGVGLPPPKARALADVSAAEFIVRTVHAHPGRVTVLALAPLTNIAQALMLDPELASKWEKLVILGGAFFVNGNVNPAAEANVFGDPDAADFVLGATDNTRILGLDVTQTCRLSSGDLQALRGAGRHGTFLADISQFYLRFHQEYHGCDAIYLHDPTAMAAVLQPGLFTWRRGAVRVTTDGAATGQTTMDAHTSPWHGHNAWTDRPRVEVALGVDSAAVVGLIKERITR